MVKPLYLENWFIYGYAIIYMPCKQIMFASASVLIAVGLQVQSNVFEGATGEVALTAAGGVRQIPGLTETFENAALVKILH